jgi:lipopolysaccharide/colanic/teichoic acid biosynthesis glycosyltransferase
MRGGLIVKMAPAPVRSSARIGSVAERRWLQALCGLLSSVVLPLLLVVAIWSIDGLPRPMVRNSVVASFGAFMAGWLWYRRLVRHPGVQGLENVLTAFIVPFALAAAILLLARFEYSRVYLASAFALTLIAFTAIEIVSSARAQRHFHVVPFGDFERALGQPQALWTLMRSPTIPADPVSGLVVDLRADLPEEWHRMIADAVLAGIPVFHVKQIEEALSGRVDIEHMSENQFGSLLPSLGYRKLKTFVDFVAAAALLPALALPFAVIAVLIKLDSPGPVLFRQRRVGFGGQMFDVYKFRTMRHDLAVRASAEERDAAMTAVGDARITRVGGALRRTRFDELPQIFNVLRGQMSWIGPRPEALPLSQWYTAELPFYRYRHIVKPGVTGWAQVNQGHVTDLDAVHDKLRYDFYYIKHFSTWLDLLVLIRTIRIVLGGFGAK